MECEATQIFGENATKWMPDMVPCRKREVPVMDPGAPEVYGRIPSDDPNVAMYRIERNGKR